MAVLDAADVAFDVEVPVAIIGAGACGQIAALTAADAGCEVLVLERDAAPQGSTALSSGMIPACETAVQKRMGIDDTVDILTADVMAKCHDEADPAVVAAVCRESGPAIDWLIEAHGVELTVVEGFLYSGHSRPRMHAPPSRTGAELIGAITRATETAGIAVLTEAHVVDLYAESSGRIRGVGFVRPDGTAELVGCTALVLACNGFGGNQQMVRNFIPDMAEANYFGHVGNQGDAVIWGEELGVASRHMGAYQGHGSLAHPHGILITWALMIEGGFQVNAAGLRFSNEHEGYSEQAQWVLAQPQGIAWDIYDARLHELGREFEDYRQAEAVGAIRYGDSVSELAATCGLPAEPLAATITETKAFARGKGNDTFGRDFTTKPALTPPYYAIRVTGSLFHTQGGLVIDANARVLRADGWPLPNLFAGGGAACGISGSADWGYLSGNGLLAAVTLGRIAGREAAAIAVQTTAVGAN